MAKIFCWALQMTIEGFSMTKPSKHHYHEEKWILQLRENVMNVENTVFRVPSLKK